MGPAGGHRETRAIDDLGFAVEDRLDQRRELHRIELEIGVLNRDDRPRACEGQ